MSTSRAILTFASAAPRGLPARLFPQGLGAVCDGVDDLTLDYDPEAQELRLTLTLSDGNAPGREVVGKAYSDLVIALVDHISFELAFPLDPPVPRMYQDPAGGQVVYPVSVRSAWVFGSGTVLPQTDVFLSRISALVPVSTLLQEFNAAAHVPNPVQQFVAYWGLLTYVVGRGSVNAVEDYLHAQGVPNEPTQGPFGPETKFARVRGEISHPADRGVQLSELPDRANSVLPELHTIVRKAVADKLGLPG